MPKTKPTLQKKVAAIVHEQEANVKSMWQDATPKEKKNALIAATATAVAVGSVMAVKLSHMRKTKKKVAAAS